MNNTTIVTSLSQISANTKPTIKPIMSKKYNDSELTVRQARREDMTAVADMIQELADFEKMPEGPKLSVKDLERDCFDRQPAAFLCKVAELDGGRLVGYAVYFPTYSTWEGPATMLEDLCVRHAERRRGVGERLFDAVAKEAASAGTRLDFHVLEWNPARGFYEEKGAQNLTQREQWCYYRLAGEALAKLAASQD